MGFGKASFDGWQILVLVRPQLTTDRHRVRPHLTNGTQLIIRLLWQLIDQSFGNATLYNWQVLVIKTSSATDRLRFGKASFDNWQTQTLIIFHRTADRLNFWSVLIWQLTDTGFGNTSFDNWQTKVLVKPHLTDTTLFFGHYVSVDISLCVFDV